VVGEGSRAILIDGEEGRVSRDPIRMLAMLREGWMSSKLRKCFHPGQKLHQLKEYDTAKAVFCWKTNPYLLHTYLSWMPPAHTHKPLQHFFHLQGLQRIFKVTFWLELNTTTNHVDGRTRKSARMLSGQLEWEGLRNIWKILASNPQEQDMLF
jgi:hypothetical protein